MASSTTLKLTDDLKRRIAPLAKSTVKTPHAWMAEALEVQAALAERRRGFVASAHAAEQEVAKYGLFYEAGEVFAYIEGKAAGRKPKCPKPVTRS